ncbi:MAG: hypothetical protein WBA88_26060 [Pseudaminobacter sp.]
MVTLGRFWKTIKDVVGALTWLAALPAIIAAIRLYDFWFHASPSTRLKAASLCAGAILGIGLIFTAVAL